jgi:hypothetical protein
VSAALRKLIRHAEHFGVAGVLEIAEAEELPAMDLAVLTEALAAIDPGWKEPPPSFVTPRGVCGRCGGAIAAKPTGRPRRYCSDACRQAAYRSRSRP